LADDGRGFVQVRGSPLAVGGSGLGLSGIAERAQILNGRAAVESAPGTGTRVHISIPLPAADQPRAEPAGAAAH
jgi:signal transduction histidine kinase